MLGHVGMASNERSDAAGPPQTLPLPCLTPPTFTLPGAGDGEKRLEEKVKGSATNVAALPFHGRAATMAPPLNASKSRNDPLMSADRPRSASAQVFGEKRACFVLRGWSGHPECETLAGQVS